MRERWHLRKLEEAGVGQQLVGPGFGRVQDEARHREARGGGSQLEAALRGCVDPDLQALFFEIRALRVAVRLWTRQGESVCTHSGST